jgi:hypothetical protein
MPRSKTSFDVAERPALLEADADRWVAQSQLDYWATKLYQPYEPPDATLKNSTHSCTGTADQLCSYVPGAFREFNQSDFFGRAHLVRRWSESWNPLTS